MTTENILRRIRILDTMNRNSKEFRLLAEFLEKKIEVKPDFDLRDSLMDSLTKVCTR